MKKLIFLTVLAVNSLGFAQAGKAGDGNVVYKKTTEIVFDGDVIDGTTTKPDVEYVVSGGGVKHSNLIKIREEFKDKVIRSVCEL